MCIPKATPYIDGLVETKEPPEMEGSEDEDETMVKLCYIADPAGVIRSFATPLQPMLRELGEHLSTAQICWRPFTSWELAAVDVVTGLAQSWSAHIATKANATATGESLACGGRDSGRPKS